MHGRLRTPAEPIAVVPTLPRRDRVVVLSMMAALGGVMLLLASIGWYVWRGSFSAEERLVGGLAATLGERTEAMILDTRRLLADLDRLAGPRCASGHLRALQDSALRRPHIRAIGSWQGAERACAVGFVPMRALPPTRADRTYASGMQAWWPSRRTTVGGVALFVMRLGDHDVAIDPRRLLDVGPLEGRQVALWVERLPFTAEPPGTTLPPPDSLAIGLTLDRRHGRAISRFSRQGELSIEIVAIEPISTFWGRYATTLVVGTAIGLALVAVWLVALLRYTRHRLSLASLLRRALAADRLHVVYQPVIDLRTGRCVGAEALARWTLEGGGAVSPDAFVPVAEGSGQSVELALTVLRAAVRDLALLLRASPHLSVQINLSAAELVSERFVTELDALLAARRLRPSAITFELTERALIATPEARATIARLRARGHRVAIDDFGTGYSSLSYLADLPLDQIKIDKAFIHSIGREAAMSQVVTHIIEMAQELGLETLAEGVETEGQRAWLAAHGVEQGQGWVFSRPLSAEAFVGFARGQRAA
ncbi:MAG: EAL domain-containing protein [Gemmatimonadetes bacterium]|nr:EAL domain-containing protein [Gemmatimonadota bacterium]